MGFNKILENTAKEYLIHCLEQFNISKTGKTTDLVNRILKNTSVLEYAIKELLSISYKEGLVGIVEDLGLDNSGSVSELKQQILQELNKPINDKNLENKIKFLNVCFDKDELFDILENYNLPKAGKKAKLMESIAKNDTMMEYAVNYLKNAYKDQIEEYCDKLGINSDGSRKDIETRLENYLSRKEKSISNQNNSQTEDTKKNINFKNKIKHFKKYDTTFFKIISTIQNDFKPQPCTDEKELQGQLTMFLSTKYPGKEIDREVEKDGAKLDIVIDGKYAIELKIARDPTTLRNLTAQLEEYQEVYPQIAALLLNIIEKSNMESIKEYAKKYDEKLKIPTIIVEGRMRKARGGLKKVEVKLIYSYLFRSSRASSSNN